MTEPAVSWPPTREQRELLTTLGTLIRRFGPERFLSTHVVRADKRDFPDAWEQTLTALHTLLYRLCWHAYFDPEIVVEDHRPVQVPDHRMLMTTEIELATTTAGVMTFHVASIGNDDVAGLLSHRVGQAFLELAPGGDPFRTTTQEITETTGSVAAVYLGLGVLVANSSMYRRYASRIVARELFEEQQVAQVGGLSIADATFLVAVQDLLRDEYQDALTTLHKPQLEWVERWTALLDPHEDELRRLLELDDHGPITLTRSAAPRRPGKIAEPDLTQFNRGQLTFRVRRRQQVPTVLGLCAGAVGFAFPFGLYIGGPLMVAGAMLGRALSRDFYECADPDCSMHMKTIVQECPRCGGTIVETIAHANQRLDRLEELEREDAD